MISVRSIPREVSVSVSIPFSSACAKKLGQPLPESAKPADGQVLRLVHLADEGETKRKIVHEDFGD